jgi:N-methylhydantoinase A
MKMVGVDVGGTFTDSVFYDDATGELRWAKALSSPANPSDGVTAALKKNSIAMSEVDRFVHGVTIGTNAILERKGASVWMLTTAGFKDTVEIARTNRSVLYNIKTLKPASLVDRTRIFEANERLYASGEVLRPLRREDVLAVSKALRAQPPGALVVCFLHSYTNPRHEREATEVLRSELPDWFICSSAEVVPEMREYERFTTTVLNAYIGPIMEQYLNHLSEQLKGDGYKSPVFIMISNGGIVTAEHAARFPVQTVLSGPAGGVAAGVHLGQLQGFKNLITYDMGGTSTDVCLVEDLNVPTTSDQLIEGYPIRTPQIDIVTIGAGGGSIAWIDTGDILKVGPKSAGAMPGPASYGRGGVEPTVTDANLVLGRLSPDLKLAGTLTLDESKATAAISRIVEKLPSLDIASAAEGVVKIAVARMVSAIKEISIDRGFDPRDFVLVAYGGAGPMHAPFIADELEMPRILVPPSPGNFSAFGALISDIRHDYVRSKYYQLSDFKRDELDGDFAAMEDVAKEKLQKEGLPDDRISLQRACGMRYAGQSWDLTVRISDVPFTKSDLEEAFHRSHEQRYGYRLTDDVEIVSVRLSSIGQIGKPKIAPWTVSGSPKESMLGNRRVRFSGKDFDTPVYSRDLLPAGTKAQGPAIIEEMGSVTVVPPQWSFEVGSIGELLLTRKADDKSS